MTTPVHHFKWYTRWRNHYKPARWSFDDRPCWLGSGINDINGQEIFEGDIVTFGEHDTKGTVIFADAMFQIAHDDKFTILGKCKDFVAVEVIGHIEEETHETN